MRALRFAAPVIVSAQPLPINFNHSSSVRTVTPASRAFASFETRFQLSWVVAGVAPVFFTLPGQVGFLVVGVFGLIAAVTYVFGSRAVKAGRPVPRGPLQKAKDGIQQNVARRRGDTASKGLRRPSGGNSRRRDGGDDHTTLSDSAPTPRPTRRGR